MTKPINLYALSRIREEEAFNAVEQHQSCFKEPRRTQYHEIESLRRLADELIRHGLSVAELDGFFCSFHIPQIGKEFDLLRFTEKTCLNIELKSVAVPPEQILEQLRKNRHYLGHLGKRLWLYTVVTDSMTCCKLSLNDELVPVSFDEVVRAVSKTAADHTDSIDDLFRASDYLVSPFSTPARFIQGEYFLTQAQEQIKKSILKGVDSAFSGAFFHLTGRPGTGKTLLLYDLAKTLSKNGQTLLVHCGKLTAGQYKIRKEIERLDIVSAGQLLSRDDALGSYSYVLVDETHRMTTAQFEAVCGSVRRNDQVCVFSSDPEQILSTAERRNQIAQKIEALPPAGTYTLSEHIRANKELSSFLLCLKNLNHRAKAAVDYADVALNYANTTQEAQLLLEYYRRKGYTFINYTKPRFAESPYADYEEDFDTHHVIGREYDKVVMLMDSSFFYDEDGFLQGIPYPDPDYLYPNLFYQGVTRVREKLALIVVNAPELFDRIVSIIRPSE